MAKTQEMQVIEHNDSIMKVAREDATWLGVIDLYQSSPVKLTIKRVVKCKGATFAGGRKEDKQAVQFEQTQKMLPLNARNIRTLWEQYGKTPDELKGKVITLAVEKLDREFNGHTHGIRIR